MEAPQIDPDLAPSPLTARARRALALMGMSVLVLAGVAVADLQPTLPGFGSHVAAKAPVPAGGYAVAAIDFVNPEVGWVVAVFDSGDFILLHTLNGGRAWTAQLGGPTRGHGLFLKFFGENDGLFALVGARPLLYVTGDGGRTWTPRPALKASSVVASWSFVDPRRGWMLVTEPSTVPIPAELYRTMDAGASWSDVGPPARGSDQAYQVQFSNPTTGWLTSAGVGPYAYRTTDSGAHWSRLALPPPAAGWPTSGQFFVTVQPTVATGLVATVVNFAPVEGRTGIGGIIRAYPPLVVRAFDGGRPHTYTYNTFNDLVTGGPIAMEEAPNQVQLASLDGGTSWSPIQVPSSTGAIGYFNVRDWWWIGPGSMSRSFDGGVTWSEARGIGVVDPIPGSLQVLDPNHAWFAAADTLPVLETTSNGGIAWRMVKLPAMEDRP